MGTLWQRSNSIERDSNDLRAAGAIARFYVGGTTTPFTVFEDSAEASPHGATVTADGNGRWPDVFIPFCTSYDVKVTTAANVQLYYPTEIPNPNPVTAAEDTVDDTDLYQTGDIHAAFTTGSKEGFVRLNGLSIGSGTSGATERANDDCEDLFVHLWNALANNQAAVSSGRGANAAADWAANKRLTLPDGRSTGLLGLDGMGNSAAGRLPIAGVFVHGNATTPGSAVGENTHTMTSSELVGHTHSFSATTSSDGAHTHTGTTDSNGAHTHTGTTGDQNNSHSHSFHGYNSLANVQSGGSFADAWIGVNGASNLNTDNQSASHQHSFTSDSSGAHTHDFTTQSGGNHTHTVSGTTGSAGSTTAFNTVHRSLLVTFFIKL